MTSSSWYDLTASIDHYNEEQERDKDVDYSDIFYSPPDLDVDHHHKAR